MRNIEQKKIKIGLDPATSERDYSVITIKIKAIREDERKIQLDKFSSRLDSIVCKAIREILTREQILELLGSESEHYSNLAAELNHV